jgi:hypothetical protein
MEGSNQTGICPACWEKFRELFAANVRIRSRIENQNPVTTRLRCLEEIRKAGPDGCTMSHLARMMRSTTPAERKAEIDSMIADGTISESKMTGTGRTTTILKIRS